MTNSNNLTNTEAKSHIEVLPPDILLKILGYMPYESIRSLILASKTLFRINSWEIVFDKILEQFLEASYQNYLPEKRAEEIEKTFNPHGNTQGYGRIMKKEVQTVRILSILCLAFKEYKFTDRYTDYLEKTIHGFVDDEEALPGDSEYLSDYSEDLSDHEETLPEESLDLLHLSLLAKKYCDMENSGEIQQRIDQLRRIFYHFIVKILNYHKDEECYGYSSFFELLYGICVNTLKIKHLRTEALNQQLMTLITDSLTDHTHPYLMSYPHGCLNHGCIMNSTYSALLAGWSMDDIKVLRNTEKSRSVTKEAYTYYNEFAEQVISNIKTYTRKVIRHPKSIDSITFEQIKLLFILKLSINNSELKLDFNSLQEALDENSKFADKGSAEAFKLLQLKAQVKHILDDTSLDTNPLPTASRLSL